MELVVVRMNGGWSILANGRKADRHYDYQVDAVDAALRLADRFTGAEEDVSVVVQDRFGELRRMSGGTASLD